MSGLGPRGPGRRRTAPIAAAIALLSAACTVDGGRHTLAVYAASSLTEAFTELESEFERAHPDVDVLLTLAGSQVLRIQVEHGAPADVFASADQEHLEVLVDAGLVGAAHTFARNRLVVIVPSDNPSGIGTFEDLPRARRLVLGTPETPVGRYARAALDAADSLLQPGFEAAVLDGLVSEESNVRLARGKVALGEADAAIVYATDAAASERIRTIDIPDAVNVLAEYLIGVVQRDGASSLAGAWVELVLSEAGQAALRRHGFATE